MTSLDIQAGALGGAVVAFLSRFPGTPARVAAVETALRGPGAKPFRRQLGEWVVRLVPVEILVPEVHRQWRPVVRDAMMFVISRLSAARLAPKIVEQIELPADTPPETRLLHLIARVPGLQKIGQVIARNRNLHPALRRALSVLENGISDVTIEEIRAIIDRQLAPQIAACGVKVDSAIYSEASVSAVVCFTWRNPETGRRERGVFKVLKPHIPSCFAEDMKILQQLAGFLARKYEGGRMAFSGVSETLTEIRLLLQHEVDFRREQATLRESVRMYRRVRGVRVPHPIQPLSTDTITALTHERGVKVTDAFARRGPLRERVAARLAEALVAVPSLATDERAIFHADPHAGNVLYDKKTGDLVILDWALTERLTRKQRRNVLLLALMVMLRDESGIASAVERLRQRGPGDQAASPAVRRCAAALLESFPAFYVPGALDAMQLLHDVALQGIRFPAALLMVRKAFFTLEGVLEDVAGVPVRADAAVARYASAHWVETGATLWTLLSPADCFALEWSAVKFVSGMWLAAVRGGLRPARALLSAWLTPKTARAGTAS